MNVSFASFGADIASSRLRADIPQRELKKLGIGVGKDVLIYGKHLLSFAHIKGFKRYIFDVCDDHFDNDLRSYYIEHIYHADKVTCNSLVMQERIYEETGVHAYVIPEPYETEEKAPSIGEKLFWYGHASNLKDIQRLMPELRHPLRVMSNAPGTIQWTPERFKASMEEDCIVVIPTGKSMAKSENRMVEAIRNGKYVCAEHLPAYEPFSKFFPLGDIPAHIEEALSHPERSIERIKDAQSYIRDKYSPETIGKKWLEVIHEYH